MAEMSSIEERRVEAYLTPLRRLTPVTSANRVRRRRGLGVAVVLVVVLAGLSIGAVAVARETFATHATPARSGVARSRSHLLQADRNGHPTGRSASRGAWRASFLASEPLRRSGTEWRRHRLRGRRRFASGWNGGRGCRKRERRRPRRIHPKARRSERSATRPAAVLSDVPRLDRSRSFQADWTLSRPTRF